MKKLQVIIGFGGIISAAGLLIYVMGGSWGLSLAAVLLLVGISVNVYSDRGQK